MVFSSLVFLFLFLPLILVAYFLFPAKWKNIWLLVASIFFYSWGEGAYALLMLVSITMNWGFGLLIEKTPHGRKRKSALTFGIILNLLPLFYFKYSLLFTSTINDVLVSVGLIHLLPEISPHLPIGISFFTFQALSYIIDVYRNTTAAQRNLINMGVFIALFPQLIAGPIVRYHDIAREIVQRKITSVLFSEGIHRFITGLSKKVLLANPLGSMADTIFAFDAAHLSTPVAWIGIVAYTLQIYFDFSGYSDMAIGLGRMLGFHFLENFNYPYIARSVREFWKRWHISLSNWFRDYLYIPLGGNRKGTLRTYSNLLTVFVLCGLWHGASWNFLLWGLAHGGMLTLERGPFGGLIRRLPSIVRHLYVLFFVVNSWVLFRCETVESIATYYKAMYGFHSSSLSLTPIIRFFDLEFMLVSLVALVLSTPLYPQLTRILFRGGPEGHISPLRESLQLIVQAIFLGALFFYSWLHLAVGAYNPFIYFRF